MIEFFITSFVSLLFVVDPIGALPAYLAMSEGDDAAKRRWTAWRASWTATLALGAFAAGGKPFFQLLGLTLPAFQIAGGLILFLVALDMIRARRQTQEEAGELTEGRDKDDIAITPLGIPILAGPAGLSAVTTLIGQTNDANQIAGLYLAILAIGLACYIALMLAEPIYRAIGRTGVHVLSRIFGLLLAAIAVQFVLDGLQAAGAIPLSR